MRVVIIGGSHAGIACAKRARKEYPGAELLLIERQNDIGFVAQSIPLFLRGDVDFLRLSSYTTIADLEQIGVKVLTSMEVTQVDVATKTLTCRDFGGMAAVGSPRGIPADARSDDDAAGTARVEPSDAPPPRYVEATLTYDKLVMATGSYTSVPRAVEDVDPNRLVVKGYRDAVRIKHFMDTARSAIVLGGGAIGVEVALAMARAGLTITILQSPPSLLDRYLDYASASAVKASIEQEGVTVHTSSLVTKIDENTDPLRRRATAFTHDGERYDADGIVYATGFKPSSALLTGQVRLDEFGAFVVDEYLRTSAPDVFAVGDCSTTLLTGVDVPTYTPHASDAFREGDCAAVNLRGPRRTMNRAQGTYSLNVGDKTLCVTGMTQKYAMRQGIKADLAYYRNQYVGSPDFYEMWVVYELGTHRLLGMQVRGTAKEIAAYVDIMSLAIERGLTIEDVEYTDFYFKHGFRNPASFTQIFADLIRAQDP